MSEKDYLLINNYEFKKDIGEGNFGKVKLGVFKKTGEEFAIKIINKDKIKQKMKNVLFKENEIITKFNHINIVYVFQIIEEKNDIYIIMEYCNRGELFDYIVSHQRLYEDEASVFFYQLINGVDYIHKKGVAHRDLKPENLLLDINKTLKIIDFGLSHEYDGNSLLKTKCGSPSYASPEIIKGQLYDGFKTDIWCCGIILYAMLCGYLPFEGDNNRELFLHILQGNPEYPSFLNKNSKKLIKGLLKINPDERLTIEQIKKSEFYLKGKKLCKIDYQSVENELEKRETFYGNGEKKFKSFINSISKIDINNDKKIEENNALPENINKCPKKMNMMHLITEMNNGNSDKDYKEQILKKNLNFKKKIDLLNNKIDQILQTDANESIIKKNQNDFKNLKKNNIVNLFNYRNNNIKYLIGKQNIYEERFQDKNNGYFVQPTKNHQNSINSIEGTEKKSPNKTKKFFTQFVTPISEKFPKNKKMISPFSKDSNYLNKYMNTETIKTNRFANNIFLNNSNNIKNKNLNKNTIENSPIHEKLFNKINVNLASNDEKQKNKSVDHKNNKYHNYQTNPIRNNLNEIHKYYSYNKTNPNNENTNNNDNIILNSVANNINIIWKNKSDHKRNISKNSNSPSYKNYQSNENHMNVKNIFDLYHKDSKKDFNRISIENREIYENKKYNYFDNKNINSIRPLKTIDNIENNVGKKNENNNIFNYRSKSRDNAKNNILKNIKDKLSNNKNILPPLDIHKN